MPTREPQGYPPEAQGRRWQSFSSLGLGLFSVSSAFQRHDATDPIEQRLDLLGIELG